MSNSIGEKFKITSFGSSHGKAVGAIVDGCPANLQEYLKEKQMEHLLPALSSIKISIPKTIPCLKTPHAHLTEIMPGW